MKIVFGILLTIGLLAAPSLWGDEPFICELGDFTIYRQLLAQENLKPAEVENKPVVAKAPVEGEAPVPTQQDLEAIQPNTLAGQTWGGTGPGRDGSCFGRSKRADWGGPSEPPTDRYRQYA